MATQNAINIPFPVSVSNGGLGSTSFTDHGILVGSGTADVTALAVGGDNSILIGNSGADPEFTTTGTPHVNSISFNSGTNSISFYEEGTFTPTIFGQDTAGTTTYTTQQGYYIRFGDIMFLQAYIEWTGATGTGNTRLGGLPYNQAGSRAGVLRFSSAAWDWDSPSFNDYTMLSIESLGANPAIRISENGLSTGTLQMRDTSGNLYYSFFVRT